MIVKDCYTKRLFRLEPQDLVKNLKNVLGASSDIGFIREINNGEVLIETTQHIFYEVPFGCIKNKCEFICRQRKSQALPYKPKVRLEKTECMLVNSRLNAIRRSINGK